jgi:hypothetical protein
VVGHRRFDLSLTPTVSVRSRPLLLALLSGAANSWTLSYCCCSPLVPVIVPSFAGLPELPFGASMNVLLRRLRSRSSAMAPCSTSPVDGARLRRLQYRVLLY